MAHAPRKISAPLGPAGSFVCDNGFTPCYLAIEAESSTKSSYKRGGSRHVSGEAPKLDASLLYSRSSAHRPRAKSEAPDGDLRSGATTPGLDGEVTPILTRSRHPSSRKISQAEKNANQFLPVSHEEAVLVIRKYSKDQYSRKNSSDSGISGMDGSDDAPNKRKKSIKFTDSDKLNKIKEADELLRKLVGINEKCNELHNNAENAQQAQRNSMDFQMQVRRGTEALDMQKGICNVLEAVDFDRKQELSRLIKATEAFKRRIEGGTILGGEHKELNDLQIGVNDLDKKLGTGLAEVVRLTTKTEVVEKRQKEYEVIQQKRREKIAMQNGAMKDLINDAKEIDDLLQEIKEINELQKEAEKRLEEFVTIMSENDNPSEIETNAIKQAQNDVDFIEKVKKSAEQLKEDIWKDKLECNKIQTAVVDGDTDMDINEAQKQLRKSVICKRTANDKMKLDFTLFTVDSKTRYDRFKRDRQEAFEHAELKRRKKLEEEERKRREAAEEAERLRKEAEEAERRRQEEEDARLKGEENERLKRERAEARRKMQEERDRKAREIAETRQSVLAELNNNTQELAAIKESAKSLAENFRVNVLKIHEAMRKVCIEELEQDPNKIDNGKAMKELKAEIEETFVESLEKKEDEVINIGKVLSDPETDMEKLKQTSSDMTTAVKQCWEEYNRLKEATDEESAKQRAQLQGRKDEVQRRRDEEDAEEARRALDAKESSRYQLDRIKLLQEDILGLKSEAEGVEMKTKEVEMVREKRRELCIDPKEAKMLDEDQSIIKMMLDFTDLSTNLQNNADLFSKILKENGYDPIDKVMERINRIMSEKEEPMCKAELQALQKSLNRVNLNLKLLRREIQKQYQAACNQKEEEQQSLEKILKQLKKRENDAIADALRRQAEIDAANAEAERLRLLAEEQRRRLEEEERRRRLLEEEEAARFLEEERRKRLMEEAEAERLRKLREEEEAERLRRLREEEEMRKRMKELDEIQDNIATAQEDIKEVEEEWKDYEWDDTQKDDEYSGILIDCLNNPALLYGIRDPKKIAEILQRVAKMQAAKEAIRREEIRLKYVCQAIEEMEERAKVAEEQRLYRQNILWKGEVPVYQPADLTCCTKSATFISDCSISAEDNKKMRGERAERKKSRVEMAKKKANSRFESEQTLLGAENYSSSALSGFSERAQRMQKYKRKDYLSRIL